MQQAPPEVWQELGQWVMAVRHPRPGSRQRAREAAKTVFAWLIGTQPERLPRGESQGRHHALQPIFDRLNEKFFRGELRAVVRWSPRMGGLSTHRSLETADGTRHLITIGRAYDHPSVPDHAVEGVVFHEMLHIVHPPRQGRGGRRVVHHAQFRAAEKAFPGYLAWKEWELREMPRRLRQMRRDS